MIIFIGEPDSNESPTCQAVQGQGKGCKSNPVGSDQAESLTGGKFHSSETGGGGLDRHLGQILVYCDSPESSRSTPRQLCHLQELSLCRSLPGSKGVIPLGNASEACFRGLTA